MDVLSEILTGISAGGSIYFCDRLASPWEMTKADGSESGFHYVRRGQCWLEFESVRQLLGPGDLVFIGQGNAHRLTSYHYDSVQAGQESETYLLCGYFEFKDPIPTPLDSALPPLLVVRADEIEERPWLKLTLSHLSAEYEAKTPGASVVVDKLTEIVLIELIRLHLTALEGHNFVGALFDPQIGGALALLHQQPDKPWTLSALAAEVAMSRAALARRFSALVGQPMFQYLTALRMRQASKRLRQTRDSVADIAESVGYSSELAFSKVFKGQFGKTPYAWRKSL